MMHLWSSIHEKRVEHIQETSSTAICEEVKLDAPFDKYKWPSTTHYSLLIDIIYFPRLAGVHWSQERNLSTDRGGLNIEMCQKIKHQRTQANENLFLRKHSHLARSQLSIWANNSKVLFPCSVWCMLALSSATVDWNHLWLVLLGKSR